jgi:hypothetical protein
MRRHMTTNTMEAPPIENTLVRYARQQLEEAEEALRKAVTSVTHGARPYKNPNSVFPTETLNAYKELGLAVARSRAARDCLEAARMVATCTCEKEDECEKQRICIRMRKV